MLPHNFGASQQVRKSASILFCLYLDILLTKYIKNIIKISAILKVCKCRIIIMKRNYLLYRLFTAILNYFKPIYFGDYNYFRQIGNF